MLVLLGTSEGIRCELKSDYDSHIGSIKTAYFSFCTASPKLLEEYTTVFEACSNLIVQRTKVGMVGRAYALRTEIIVEAPTIKELIEKLHTYQDGFYIVDKFYDSQIMSGEHNHPEKMHNIIMYEAKNFSYYYSILPSLRKIKIDEILQELC